MMRAIIVEDEINGQEALLSLLQEFCPEVEVIGICDSVESAIAMITEKSPNLVFLDIHLQNGNGFEILESLEKIDFNIIFTTADDDYALRALKMAALDYLLKPININELTLAVEKAENNKISPKEQVPLLNMFVGGQDKKLALPDNDGFSFVKLSEIVRCESDTSYTTFYLSNKDVVTVCKSLKDFEELLIDFDFCRVHKSHLINLFHIKKILRNDAAGLVMMADESVLPISRRKKDELMLRLKNLC